MAGPGGRKAPGLHMFMTRHPTARGYSLLEVIFVVALGVTMSAVAVPQYLAAIDDFRASGAARYVSARLQRARMEAVMRSTSVAIQFAQTPGGYSYTGYLDGNGNGVLAQDIRTGVDRLVNATERLRDHFSGVDFGAVPGLPPIDPGGPAPGNDPIRLVVDRHGLYPRPPRRAICGPHLRRHGKDAPVEVRAPDRPLESVMSESS